jgi:addiction module HigA family antidote
MTAAKTYPCDYDWEPIPPGETILEMLDYHGLTQKELAERTGYSAKHINQVVLGNAPITSELSIFLERVLGTSAKTWNNLEANYQTRKANWQEKERLSQYRLLLKKPAIVELKKRRYIATGDTAQEIESVLRFFGTGTVESLDKICDVPIRAALRHSPSFDSEPLALAAWLRIGEREAVKIECKAYDKTGFQETLKKIRNLTVKSPKEFESEMVRLCADAGVALVFVPEMKGIKAYGATKWLTSDKAMIVLNLRSKKNDVFWFTFFHESAHILFDGKKAFVVEVTGSRDQKNESERRADKFAASCLIPQRFASELYHLKTESDIISFAERLSIAPGIVVGRMQFEKIISFNKYNHLKETFVWGESE